MRGGHGAFDALGVGMGIRRRQPSVLQDVGLLLIGPGDRGDTHRGAVAEGLADRLAPGGGPGRETHAPTRPDRRLDPGTTCIGPSAENRRSVVARPLQASTGDRGRQQGVVGRRRTRDEQRKVAVLVLAKFVDGSDDISGDGSEHGEGAGGKRRVRARGTDRQSKEGYDEGEGSIVDRGKEERQRSAESSAGSSTEG